MQTLGSRLKQLRKELQLTQQQLADKIGVSKTSVIYWEKDENTPKHESLTLLAKLLSTTTEWLLKGENEKTLKSDLFAQSHWNRNIQNSDIEVPYLNEFSEINKNISIALTETKTKLRISNVTLQKLELVPTQVFAISSSGESMSPTIKDGDTVYIDMARKNIKDGRVFAIFHGGLFSIKRLYNLPLGGVRIVSDNSNEFPEVTLNAQEIKDQQFEVIGWVWQISSLEKW